MTARNVCIIRRMNSAIMQHSVRKSFNIHTENRSQSKQDISEKHAEGSTSIS